MGTERPLHLLLQRIDDPRGDPRRGPWFVASDACCVLYDPAYIRSYSASSKTQRLAKDERKRIWASDPVYRDLFRDTRKCPSMSLISESGLYRLIMRSDKPEARTFQDWVTYTVLPAIRKDGG